MAASVGADLDTHRQIAENPFTGLDGLVLGVPPEI